MESHPCRTRRASTCKATFANLEHGIFSCPIFLIVAQGEGSHRVTRMELTLRPRFIVPDHEPLSKYNPLQYEVVGLPPDVVIWIGEPSHRMKTGRWKILRIAVLEGGYWVRGVWTGDYESPEAALAAIQAEYPMGTLSDDGSAPLDPDTGGH